MSSTTIEIDDRRPESGSGFWQLEFLVRELARRGVQLAPTGQPPGLRLIIYPPDAEQVQDLTTRWADKHGCDLTTAPESFAMAAVPESPGVLVTAADVRGLGHALLELSDIVRHGDETLEDLRGLREYLERPQNPARSVNRVFTTAATDLSWFRDPTFWTDYLDGLALQRFNRFSLALGASNDYLIDRRVTDNYLCLPYPFLLDVPGYEVHVEGLSPQERDRNLEAMRFIGAECTRRGIDFGLGLWNHSYRYDPDADTERWPITGLDGSTHATYCRDGLIALLRACPDVRRLTIRVHFEGGVPEPTHEFWRVVLSGLPLAGRPIELDLHSKGVSVELLDIATGLGVPLTLSTKYWAEHLGLPYHQASIREKERTRGRPSSGEPAGAWEPGTGHPDVKASGTQTTSRRSFTRYSYGDYAYRGRPATMLHRVWPGTQRVLLWGDPVLAAGYSRYANFADALGIEWFEPLSFLGKKDSAAIGSPESGRADRKLYCDPKLQAVADDWRKYEYTYRLLGRTAYNPETPTIELIRPLRAAFGDAAGDLSRALGAASRVLPLVTVAHTPSTACNIYWPEMPTTVPLVARTAPVDNPYRLYGWAPNSDFDMTPPYSFGNVSPLDPELFYGVDEFAEHVLNRSRRGKHSPIEVADRLDALADEALGALADAEKASGNTAADPRFAVYAIDVRIQAALARFFALELRAAVAYGLRPLGHPLLRRAVKHHRAALAAWDQVIAESAPYLPDLPFGQTTTPAATGRIAGEVLPPISRRSSRSWRGVVYATESVDADAVEQAMVAAPAPAGTHTPPDSFVPGEAVPISWRSHDDRVRAVRLRYRPVNQALAYEAVELQRSGEDYTGEIPAEATAGLYPVQYFFEVFSDEMAWPFPGLDQDLANQPYYVVHDNPLVTWGRASMKRHQS